MLITSSAVFAEAERLTRKDYLIKLYDYINECNHKLDEIDAQYEKETIPKIQLLNNLKEQVHDAYMKYSECENNAGLKELANGPCGHLMNKTTFFKTSSGLVVADEAYAINKCLAQLPAEKGKWAPAKACKTKYNAYKKVDNNIKTLEKELSTLEK